MTASKDQRPSRDLAAATELGHLSQGSSVLPPLAGIVELVVITGLILTIDMMLPDVDIADIQPNPFWLPVLLLSLQYGTVSGVLAAATALLVTLLSGLPEAGVGENYFNYAMRVFAQPILWFGAAVLLGQFRMRQIEAKRGLTMMVLDLEQQRAALAGYAQGLRSRCDMLERDRAGLADAPGLGLLASLADLDSGSGELAPAFARTIEAAFPGARASVLALVPTGLVTIASTSTGTTPAAPSADLAHPLYRALIGEGRLLSVLQPGDEHRLAGTGLAAVPVRDAAGNIIGAVRLEAAEPSALSAGTLPALGIIAAALAPRLTPAARGLDGRQDTVQSPPQGWPEATTGAGVPVRRLLHTLSWLTRRREGGEAGNDPSGDTGASHQSKALS